MIGLEIEADAPDDVVPVLNGAADGRPPKVKALQVGFTIIFTSCTSGYGRVHGAEVFGAARIRWFGNRGDAPLERNLAGIRKMDQGEA